MDFDLIEARYAYGWRVWLRFRDGTEGEVDLLPRGRGPIFEPLMNESYFRRFTIHPEGMTLVWPNGANHSPEYLHDLARVTAWAADREAAHAVNRY